MTVATRRSIHRHEWDFSHISLADVIASVLLLVTSGCTRVGAPAATVTRTDSAGVEIVANSGRETLLGWTLDPILDVRSPTGMGGDTVGFLDVTDVAVVGGRIVVLDRSVPALFVYDSLGHIEGRYGRKGQGPGEFEYPVSLAVAPDGGWAVFDMGNARIERFDESFAPSEAISLLGIMVRQGLMRFAGDAAVLPTSSVSGDTVVFGLEAVSPGGTNVLGTLRQQRNSRPITLKSCGLWFRPGSVSPVFAPELHWTPDRRGHVLLVKGDEYDIEVYGGRHFTLRRRIRRDQAPIEATEEMAVKSLGEAMEIHSSDGTRMCDPAEMVEQQGFAPRVPALGEMRVDAGGNTWVHRWVPEGDPLIDVFDSTGVYLGTLRDQPMPTMFLGDDRAILKRTDAMDVPFLTIYRIVR